MTDIAPASAPPPIVTHGSVPSPTPLSRSQSQSKSQTQSHLLSPTLASDPVLNAGSSGGTAANGGGTQNQHQLQQQHQAASELRLSSSQSRQGQVQTQLSSSDRQSDYPFSSNNTQDFVTASARPPSTPATRTPRTPPDSSGSDARRKSISTNGLSSNSSNNNHQVSFNTQQEGRISSSSHIIPESTTPSPSSTVSSHKTLKQTRLPPQQVEQLQTQQQDNFTVNGSRLSRKRAASIDTNTTNTLSSASFHDGMLDEMAALGSTSTPGGFMMGPSMGMAPMNNTYDGSISTGGVNNGSASGGSGAFNGGPFNTSLKGGDTVCLCKAPPKVPRPRNAFILFRQHHQSAVAQRHPGLANPEISRIIGKQWKNCSPEVQDYWKRLAEEEKQRHQQQYPDYRYQPRRGQKGGQQGRPSSSGGVGGSGVGGGEGAPGRCPNCRGRYLATPRTPHTTVGGGFGGLTTPKTPVTTQGQGQSQGPTSGNAMIGQGTVVSGGEQEYQAQRMMFMSMDEYRRGSVSGGRSGGWYPSPGSSSHSHLHGRGDEDDAYIPSPVCAKRPRYNEPGMTSPTTSAMATMRTPSMVRYPGGSPATGSGRHGSFSGSSQGGHNYPAGTPLPPPGNMMMSGRNGSQSHPQVPPTPMAPPPRPTGPSAYTSTAQRHSISGQQGRPHTRAFDESLRLPPLQTAGSGHSLVTPGPDTSLAASAAGLGIHSPAVRHPSIANIAMSGAQLGGAHHQGERMTNNLETNNPNISGSNSRNSTHQNSSPNDPCRGLNPAGQPTNAASSNTSAPYNTSGLHPHVRQSYAHVNMEDLIMRMSFVNKIKVLAQISPPLPGMHLMNPSFPVPSPRLRQTPSGSVQSGRSGSPGAPSPRGAVIAVEASTPALLEQVGGLVERVLMGTEECAVRVWKDEDDGSGHSRAGSRRSSSDAGVSGTASGQKRKHGMISTIDQYLSKIMSWHRKGEEVVKWVSRNPCLDHFHSVSSSQDRRGSDGLGREAYQLQQQQQPSPQSQADFETEAVNNITSPAAVAPMTLLPPMQTFASSHSHSQSSNPPTSVVPGTQGRGPQQAPRSRIPIALFPTGFSLTLSDAFSVRIPIADSYAPVDHWQWMATLWRGVVGPDITIYAQGIKEGSPEAQGSSFRPVEFIDGRLVVVRVLLREMEGYLEGEKLLDESTERRLGFEILEWVRTGGQKVRELVEKENEIEA
ncbi:putative hmg box protein [Zalerion maritima]|uniref:Hmg box protein n=1 Tax=Zalerion maritima TaxID=339359 RepID=A0AAD5RV98_9PEZI|nr:putative hmg box protein [Zalerion maritima]